MFRSSPPQWWSFYETNYMKTQERIQLFSNELNSIKNDKLRQFAICLLENAPDYFFSVPASSSGKYHPDFAREVGGLVKHTKCVIFFSQCNAQSFNFDDEEQDLIIIAALAHDIKKQGNNDTGKHTLWEHPRLASEYIMQMYNKYNDLISKEKAKKISDAIISHMGKWAHMPEYTKNKEVFPMPKNIFEMALQSADYIASRNEINFKFPFYENVVIKGYNGEQSKQVLTESDNFTFNFGKHKGKTIKEVISIAPDYIKWMLSTKDFSNPDLLEQIKTYINNNSIKF